MPTVGSKIWFYANIFVFVSLVVAILVLVSGGRLGIISQPDASSIGPSANGVGQPGVFRSIDPRAEASAVIQGVSEFESASGTLDPTQMTLGSATPPPIQTTPEPNHDRSTSESLGNTPAVQPFDPDTATVDELILATESTDWKSRWDAVNALGVLGDPLAVPALVARALLDDNPHPRWRSLWALKSVDAQGGLALPLLREGLDNGDDVEIRNAAVALAFFKQSEAQPELLAGLNDGDPWRRWEAVFSLKNIGDADAARAVASLLVGGVETDVRTRQEAALTLGKIGSDSSVPPLLSALGSDPSPAVRWRSALALSRLGSPLALTGLNSALLSETDDQVRKHIADAITALGGK